MYFPVLRIGYGKVCPKEGDEIFGGGLFPVLMKVCPPALFAIPAISVATYTIQLMFVYVLGLLAEGDGEDVHDVVALALLGAAAFFMSILKINVDAFLSGRLVKTFEGVLRRQSNFSLSLTKSERVASRDLIVVLDNVTSGMDVISIPLFIFFSSLLAVVLYGVKGLLAIAIVLMAVPFTYFLSKLADRNYDKIMVLSADRIEKCGRWLKGGALKKQFSENDDLLLAKTAIDSEIKARNVDTILRGADNYIIGFGRLLPYVAILMLGLVGDDAWSGAILWVSIPLISAVLSFPAAYVNFKSVSRSLIEIDKFEKEVVGEVTCFRFMESGEAVKIDFDRNWPIWPGSVEALVCFDHHQFPDVISEYRLMEVLRLIPELGNSAEEVLEKYIEMDGRNISEGQRLRLQLFRGIIGVKKSNAVLYIDDDFGCIDYEAAAAIVDHLRGVEHVVLGPKPIFMLKKRYRLSTAYTHSFARSEVVRDEVTYLRSELKGMKVAYVIGVGILAIPAFMLSYSANLTIPGRGIHVWSIVFYALLGVAIGASAGLFVEREIRTRFARLFEKGLKDIREGGSINLVQLVSRDLTIVFERISWYVHDFSWISALLICNIFALWIGFGVNGLVVTSMLGVTLLGLYCFSIDELFESRLEAVHGYDSLTRAVSIADAFAQFGQTEFGRSMPDFILRKKNLLVENIGDFYVKRMRSVICRSVMSVSCAFVCDSAMTVIALIWAFFGEGNSSLVFAITALLLVKSGLSNAFLAITGFKSQSMSVWRIAEFAGDRRGVSVRCEFGKMVISGFRANQEYHSKNLIPGFAYSLTGRSGSGKSDYMKGVAGIVDVQVNESRGNVDCSVFYINKEVVEYFGVEIKIPGDLANLWDRLPAGKNRLLLLDEICGSISVDSLDELRSEIERYAAYSGDTLMVVDHRFYLSKIIDVGELVIC